VQQAQSGWRVQPELLVQGWLRQVRWQGLRQEWLGLQEARLVSQALAWA
jgi:hypothetical protein